MFPKADASNSGLESPVSMPVFENGTFQKIELSLYPKPALFLGITHPQLCLQPRTMSGLCLF